MDAYFDTNVYGHIYRRQHGITDADVEKLEKAIEADKLRIFTSFPAIEETNVARLSSLEEANGRLELIRTLAVQDQMIKHHADIVEGDIIAYANGTDFPGKLEAPLAGLRSLFFDHTAKNYEELKKVAEETQEQVVKYSQDMNRLFNDKLRPIADQLKKQKSQQTFSDYWQAMAEPWAEQVADHFGQLEKCKAKGIAGLLDVQSVRLNTIAQTSLTYANTYERQSFDTGNSRDMHHVVCASAVPVFVTHDRRFVNVLARMPTPGLEVINFHTLLNRL
jgi:hypothetical protein